MLVVLAQMILITFFAITRKVKTNVYSLLNIAKTGIIAQNELADMQQIDEASLQKLSMIIQTLSSG